MESIGLRPRQMERLLAAHLGAAARSDTGNAVAMFAEDVEVDLVGVRPAPVRGRLAAQRLYDQLVQEVRTEELVPLHWYYGDDFCVVEHRWTGTVQGRLFGTAGRGRRITFRTLHVVEFRGSQIGRLNLWLDHASVVEQLSD